jgi:hypothetical protein
MADRSAYGLVLRIADGTIQPARRCSVKSLLLEQQMIGKLIGAAVGKRMAGRNQGLKGALLGAAAPWLVRRAFTPLGVAALGAYGAKRFYDRRRARRSAEGMRPL